MAAPTASSPSGPTWTRFPRARIPAGGTFTGAEGIKTPEQAKRYGGTAGAPHDPNHHGAGDTLRNVDLKAFDTNLDVIAHAVGTCAADLRSLGRQDRGGRGGTRRGRCSSEHRPLFFRVLRGYGRTFSICTLPVPAAVPRALSSLTWPKN